MTFRGSITQRPRSGQDLDREIGKVFQLKVICEKTAAAVLNRCRQVEAVTKLETVTRPDDRGSLEDRSWQRNHQQIRAVEKSVVVGKKRSVVEP